MFSHAVSGNTKWWSYYEENICKIDSAIPLIEIYCKDTQAKMQKDNLLRPFTEGVLVFPVPLKYIWGWYYVKKPHNGVLFSWKEWKISLYTAMK